MQRTLALLCLAVALLSAPAWAWGKKKDKPAPVSHIVVIAHDNAATQVRPGQYYTQLLAGIEGVNLPSDPGKGKRLFAQILTALGGKKESREVSVVLKVTSGGVALPEYALASYKLTPDGRVVLTDTAQHFFPIQRLDAGHLVFDLGFRDARGVEYDLGAVSKGIVGLLPASAVVSELSKPVFQKLADTASTVLGAVGTYDGSYARHFELAPAGDGDKMLKLQLNTADGTAFGVVTLELLASPTLLHNAKKVFKVSDADLHWADDEDLSQLQFDLGSVPRTYLGEARALGTYADLLKTRTDEAVGNYCNAARDLLGAKHGLTPMDRTALVLESMRQADFLTTGSQVRWYPRCFNGADRAVLLQTKALDPSLGSGVGGNDLTVAEGWAFGCWMFASPGRDCQQNAPDPGKLLESMLADRVEVVIDSSFVDASGWGEEGVAAKAAVIAGLKAVPSGFRCIRKGGMLVTPDATGKAFRLKGVHAGDKLASISIQPASQAALNCND
jgi:hypothetical protein